MLNSNNSRINEIGKKNLIADELNLSVSHINPQPLGGDNDVDTLSISSDINMLQGKEISNILKSIKKDEK
jgi:hypothetical protein